MNLRLLYHVDCKSEESRAIGLINIGLVGCHTYAFFLIKVELRCKK